MTGVPIIQKPIHWFAGQLHTDFKLHKKQYADVIVLNVTPKMDTCNVPSN